VRYDSLEKRTRIRFKVADGKLVHFYDGTPISELREGTIGEIIVNDFEIKDEARVRQYNLEADVDFLPEGTRLLARISTQSVPEHLRKRLHPEGNYTGDSAVEIILQTDLRLHLRGTKEAQLLPCVCEVPALAEIVKDELPASLNQAYTLISTHFEPHRRSHTGNVFNCVFYCPEPLYLWQPLKTLRDQYQAEHESMIAAKPNNRATE
jgi:hypothetical protein